MRIGEYIQNFMNENKVSVDFIATESGIKKTTLEEYLRRRDSKYAINLETVEKIAKVTGESREVVLNAIDEDITFEKGNADLKYKKVV